MISGSCYHHDKRLSVSPYHSFFCITVYSQLIEKNGKIGTCREREGEGLKTGVEEDKPRKQDKHTYSSGSLKEENDTWDTR